MVLNIKIQRVLSKLNKQSNRERQGRAKVASGREMLAITADTGMLFSILLKAMKAQRILEVGTSAGFSTIWFANAVLSANSKPYVLTIEKNHQKVVRARKNFQQAHIDNMIEIKEGLALDVLRKIKKKNYFDFVFLDADKENLVEYFDLVLSMVRVGGIIAADNMLYPKQYRPWVEKYLHHVRNKKNVESVTVPIGMGEEFTIRLN